MIEDDNKAFTMESIVPIMLDVISSGSTFEIIVNGNSMSPFLRNGKDVAVFTSLAGRRIKRGDIVLFQRRNKQYVMHRVYKVSKDKKYTFVGDNQTELEKNIDESQLKAYVCAVKKDNKIISCEKGIYKKLYTMFMLVRVKNSRLAWKIFGILKKIKNTFKRIK